MHLDEEIVISGISGKFPESGNIAEFRDNLLNNANLVTINERRFKAGVYGIPSGFGALKEIDKFDADFFHVLPKQAAKMDPQLRMMMETVHEAMMDSGVNPKDQGGSITGVFANVCHSEAHRLWSTQASKTEGPTMTGCTKSMFANRISYAFDFLGPSACYDTACSSSIVALEAAVASMRAGKCDAAIVTAANLILTPHTTLEFQKLGMLSPDSTCKAFDIRGDGYVRAEAVATIYLQKASVAKRIYASILNIKTFTDGFKQEGITYPSTIIQEKLLQEAYDEAGVNKGHVTYVECHGTGTNAGDPAEFQALQRSFSRTLKNRGAPLYLGSLKSNMGHAEGASGLCSIAKIVIMMQEGIIPANLHYYNPHYSMKGVRDGTMKIVDKNTAWVEGLVALNSFGFGGVNAHLILKPYHDKRVPKDRVGKGSNIPELITVSGRTEIGVQAALQTISAEKNIHLNHLINECHKTLIRDHHFRGFSLPDCDITNVQETFNDGSDVWFVFNGMGSQWAGIGKDLLEIPTFSTSLKLSHDTLLTRFGFNLNCVLSSPDSDSALHCFVTIAAIQIGIVDVLTSLGVRPAGYIGHSAGEMLCAYVDGCLSAEETIICAYLRGISCTQEDGRNTDPTKYGMAVIGVDWAYASKTCPYGVYPACHNGVDSVTVSGPSNLLEEYVAKMRQEKRRATHVDSCGIAFHSPYLEKSSQGFLTGLRGLIQTCHVRSKKWISTSIPKGNWPNTKLALTASPEYFVNNFTSPVLFHDALKEIPEGATIIEIGPSGLLKGLIKRGVPNSNVISVQSRDSTNGLTDFVASLGQMFIAGVKMNVNKLYGANVKFPVPLGTPFISPLIDWDHDYSWDVPIYGKNGEFLEGGFHVDLATDEDRSYGGHQIQGRVLFPATGYLLLVWKFFAQTFQTHFEKFPVVFENVKFKRVTVLRESGGGVEFRINVSDLSGHFEIKEGGAVISSGTVRRPHTDNDEVTMSEEAFTELQQKEAVKISGNTEYISLTKPEIYKQLRFLGYEYGGLFKGIRRRDLSGKHYLMEWNSNWVAFLDTMMQTTLGLFGSQSQTELPTEIQKAVIFPEMLLDFIANNPYSVRDDGLFVLHEKSTNIVRTCGIEITGLRTTGVPGRGKEPAPSLSTYTFRPFMELVHDPKCLCPILQSVIIFMENIKSRATTSMLEIMEIAKNSDSEDSMRISNLIRVDYATPDINYTVFSEEIKDGMVAKFAKSNVNLVCIESASLTTYMTEEMRAKTFDLIIMDNTRFLDLVQMYLPTGGFLLLKLPLGQNTAQEIEQRLGSSFALIAHKVGPTEDIFLTRRIADKNDHMYNLKVVNISTTQLDWVDDLRELVIDQENHMLTSNSIPPLIYLVSNGQEDQDSGILGLTLCLRKEPFCSQIRCIFSRKYIPLDFSTPDDFLSQILRKDLAINVIDEEGRLGSYFHSPSQAVLLPSQHAFVSMGTIGDLTTLHWMQGFPHDDPSLPVQEEGYSPVKVHVAALNFRDIMLATGNLQLTARTNLPFTLESHLGLEFSGVTGDGDRVCGFSEGQSLATSVYANDDWLWKIPNGWSFEEAATVPVVYSTVYLALVMRGQIRNGESILIHSGAGGVGQAAIRVALSMNCTVYTTVGSKQKETFIKTTFPQIPPENIGCSRDTTFERMVLLSTGGRGVDLILNSLTGDKLEASVRCLARHGRFLEIGKVDLVSNKNLGMHFFLQDASYHGVMLDSLWDAAPSVRAELRSLLQSGLDSGVVTPLPYRLFNHQQVEPAFRFMGQGQHIGKVLISLEETPILAHPHVYFNPSKSYIIIGGLGGIGLEFCNWMTTRSAKNIVLTTRSGIKNAYQSNYIQLWERNGVQVKILQLDAADPVSARTLVHEAGKLGPVGGFFNLAMQLHIDLMKLQTPSGFSFAMDPKVKLSRNLGEITRISCPELDHFVVFSSVAAGFGFDGQANYGFANSAAERLVERRVKDGLPGKAVQWGPIGEVGAWHDSYNADFTRKSFHGSGVQSIASALNSLDALLGDPSPVMLSRRTVDADAGHASTADDLSLVERIAHVLGHMTNHHKLNMSSKLADLGMDSVMSMEVKQILEQDFNLFLSAAEIRNCTLKQFQEMASNCPKNKLVGASKLKVQAATAGLVQLNFIKTMSRSRFIHDQCVHPLNSLAHTRIKERELGVKMDPGHQGTIFIINSLEGPDVLNLLAGYLLLPAYSMQIPKEIFDSNNFNELSDFYLDKIRETEPKGPYTIVGYSAGTFVAIELGLKFQETHEITKLILLDITPGRMRAILDENFGKDRTHLDESELIVMMVTQVFGFDRNLVESILRKEKNTEQQYKAMTQLLTTVFEADMTVDDMEEVMSKRALTFLKLMDQYHPALKFHEPVVLIRTTQNLISYDSNELWGLDEFCTQTPTIVTLDTTHSYMLTDPFVKSVANYINP